MKTCKYYLTYTCNSKCEYCNIWKIKGITPLSFYETKKRLDELKELGVTYVDFTGGEPMLHPDFVEILKYAHSLGLKVEFTTNGYAFDKYLDEVIDYIDYPNISLDSLNRENYKNIRKIDGLDKAMYIAKRLGKKSKNAKIISVVTDSNTDELPSLLKFAQDCHIQIYFSPLFEYFDGMKPDCKYDTVPLEDLFFEPYSIIPLHFIEFFKKSDRNKYPICLCNEDVITVSPEGKIISPCFYYEKAQLGKKNQPLTEIVSSDEFKEHMKIPGTLPDCCKGCTTIPYLGFSLEYKLDYISLLNLFSINYQKVKVELLNEASNIIELDIDSLNKEYTVLYNLINSIYYNNDNKHIIYTGEKLSNGLIDTHIFNKHITPVKYLFDNLSENIWSLNYLPYRFIEDIFNILLEVKQKMLNNEFNYKHYFQLLNSFPLFYTSWWIYFVLKNYKVNENNIDISKYEKIISDYLSLIKKYCSKFDSLITNLYFNIEKFEIMRKNVKPYVVNTYPHNIGNKNLTNAQINNIIKKLRKDKTYILSIIEQIDFLSIESINLLISNIKSNFSTDEINVVKRYIDVYRYKENVII